MSCKYNKMSICNKTCKWYTEEGCMLELIENKMESPQAIEQLHNAVEIDNKPEINSCIYCGKQLSGHINIFQRDIGIFQVFCDYCHLRGPYGTTVQEAIANYNSLPAGGSR